LVGLIGQVTPTEAAAVVGWSEEWSEELSEELSEVGVVVVVVGGCSEDWPLEAASPEGCRRVGPPRV
jgi:hypothetical protein